MWGPIDSLGIASIGFGLAIWAVDWAQGMPWWWTLAEGALNIGLGATILGALREIPRGFSQLER